MITAIAPPPTDHPSDTDGLAQALLTRYDGYYQGTIRLLSLSENATYAVSAAAGRRYVLRIHRPRYHTAAAVRSELAWLAALQAACIEVPRAIPGADNELLQHVGLPGQSTRMGVLFDWIDGCEPDPNGNLLTSFERLGSINARLHEQARCWCPPAGFERPTWDHATMLGAGAHWGDWRQAPHLRPADQNLIEQTIAPIGRQLAIYGQDTTRFGLIHADLRLANLLVDGECTRVIDFDDCGFGWYLHDLASALSFQEHHRDASRWIAHWLHGYARVASLAQADLDVLPSLLVQRRLQLLAWTGTHANTELARSLGPAWVAQTLPLCHAYLDSRLRFG
jgi:Ser/Thr protein kinase RdoA (MazF antagonist)